MAQVLSDALRVDFGYSATPLTPLGSISWTDVTSSVRLGDGVTFNRGRSGIDVMARPGSLSFTLDNSTQKGTEGRFTLGGTNQVTGLALRIPVRVRALYSLRTNLALNPSIETATTGWSTGGGGGGTLTRDATQAYSGTYSLKVTTTGAGNSLVLYGSASRTPVTAGTTYSFSAYVRSAATSRLVDIVANWYDAGGASLSTTSGTQISTSTSAWVRPTHTVAAPALATSVVIQVRLASVVSSEVHYVDGLLLEAAASAGTYFDGSTTNASWTGTANASTSTVAGSSTYVDLWYGYVESLETGWDNGWRPTVRVSATDRLARLEKRKLPSLIRGVQLVDSPSALWPCDDSDASVSAGEQSSNAAVTALTGVLVGATTSTLTFGQAGLGPGPDGQSCAVLTPITPNTTGWYLTGSGLPDAFTNTQSVEVYFQAATAGTASRGLATLHDTAFTRLVTISLSATDKLVATTVDSSASLTATVTGATTVTSGVWHHAVLTQSRAADTVTVTLYLDGVSQGTPATYSTASSSATIISGGSISAGALRAASTGTASGIFYGRLANVAVYPTALSSTRITEHARVRDTLASYTAETSAAKFTRLAQVAGLSSTEYGFSYGSSGATSATMTPFPVADRSLLDAASDVATAEASAVYLDRSGVLRLAARDKRYGTAVSFTIPATAIDKGTGFTTDMGPVINDVTVSRPSGITARSVDAASVAAYDTHDSTTTVYVATDPQVVDMSAFLANLNSQPVPRISGISVDLVSGAAILDEASILAAEVGTRFQVTGLPSASTPAATLDLIVDGLTDTVNATSWRRAFVCTQIDAGSTVWVLDDSTYSKLDSTTVLAF